jgi:hypothetical protein
VRSYQPLRAKTRVPITVTSRLLYYGHDANFGLFGCDRMIRTRPSSRNSESFRLRDPLALAQGVGFRYHTSNFESYLFASSSHRHILERYIRYGILIANVPAAGTTSSTSGAFAAVTNVTNNPPLFTPVTHSTKSYMRCVNG